MPDFTQPDQQFSLQEVAQHCGLAPYIIRYWEIHFPQLSAKSVNGRTLYTSNDVALIWRIKKLLYVDHLTIDQAKAQLAAEQAFPVQYPGAATTAPAAAKPAQSAPVPAVEEPEPETVEEPQPVVEVPVETVKVEEVAAAPVVEEVKVVEVPAAPAAVEDDGTKELLKTREAELQQLRADMAELTREVEALRDARESLMRENEELKAQLENEQASRAGLNDQHSNLAQENAHLKSTMGDILSQLKEVSSSLARV